MASMNLQDRLPPRATVRSAIHLSMLEGLIQQKLETVARTGCQAVVLGSSDWPQTSNELDRLKDLLWSFRLEVAALETIPEDPAKAPSMAHPPSRETFLQRLTAALELARQLEATGVCLAAGPQLPDVPLEQQQAQLVDTLRLCLEAASASATRLLLKPQAWPGYPPPLLRTAVEAASILDRLAHPSLKLWFDCYVEQTQSGNVTSALRQTAPYLELVEVAGVPDRCEPWDGELYYPNLYRTLGELGFRGTVVWNYRPRSPATRSLVRAIDEMRAALASSPSTPGS